MSAQPLPERAPEDPAEILRALPAEHHAAFLAEYTAAIEDAPRPEQSAALTALLQLWRLRAAAYAVPGYLERLAAAADSTGDVPAEDLIPGWPRA